MASLVEMQADLVYAGGWEPVSKFSDRTKANLKDSAGYLGAAGLGGWGAATTLRGAGLTGFAEQARRVAEATPGLEDAAREAKMLRRAGGATMLLGGAMGLGSAALAGKISRNRKKRKKKIRAAYGKKPVVKSQTDQAQPEAKKAVRPVNYTNISDLPPEQLAAVRRRKRNPALRREDNEMLGSVAASPTR